MSDVNVIDAFDLREREVLRRRARVSIRRRRAICLPSLLQSQKRGPEVTLFICLLQNIGGEAKEGSG